MQNDENQWRTPSFRQNVVAKINEAILQSGSNASRNSIEMENHVFVKARTKDEYLSFVARLILHVREISLKNKGGAGGDVNNPGVAVGAGMQDPINALQNMTSTATRNPQMMGMSPQGGVHPGNMGGGGNVGGIPASNLLQTLTQQRPGPNQQQQQQMQMQNMQNARGGQMMSGMGGVQMGGNVQGGNMPPGVMNNAMGGGNMNMGMQNNMQNQGQMSGGIQGGPMNQMTGGQMQMVGNPQMGQMGGMNMSPGMNQNQMGQMGGMNVPGMGQMNPIVINQLNANNPGGMPQQSPMVSQIGIGPQNIMVQNQMGPGGQMNPNQMMNMQQNMGRKPQEMMMGNPGNTFSGVRSVTPNQFLRQSPSPQVPSPAGITQGLQGSQMVPSPALVPSPNPMPNMMGGQPRSNMNVMQPSPSSSINTPGQIAVPSPLNPQEEHLYREKFRQLSKYIEPLKRMIARMGNDDVEKHQKMNKLLELLCNPKKRIPLDTLLKCEKALEKMDFKGNSVQAGGQMTSLKEHQFNNPLLEAVKATLQSPLCNHTLQRTFRPCMESLFGPDIKNLPPSEKRARLSLEDVTPTSTPAIPHILQGEIARLDQKFKVSLDPAAQMGTKTIKLVCCLDDKYLPCVPPVSVSIPEDYPSTAPGCYLIDQEYNATPFLSSVQKALTSRISKLPRQYSLSNLLDTWEMSVRQACSPVIVPPTTGSVLLGV